MKILVIGVPRTGTFSLFKYISESLSDDYLSIDNPYRYNHDFQKSENMVVRITIDNNILLKKNESLESKCFDIIKDYDKIIFLMRSNNTNLKNSFANFLASIYKSNDIEEFLIKADRLIDEWSKVFYKISNNSKIYTYEEIFNITPTVFFLEMISYLNLHFNPVAFLEYIHPENKNKFKPFKTLL